MKEHSAAFLSVSVSGGKSMTNFSASDIKQFLKLIKSKDQNIFMADNVPKWCYIALLGMKKVRTIAQASPIIEQLLTDVIDGKIKQIIFKYDANKNILGFRNLVLTEGLLTKIESNNSGMKIIKSVSAPSNLDDRAFESIQYSVDRIERFSKDIERAVHTRDTSTIHNNAVNIRSLCEAILSELKKVKS